MVSMILESDNIGAEVQCDFFLSCRFLRHLQRQLLLVRLGKATPRLSFLKHLLGGGETGAATSGTTTASQKIASDFEFDGDEAEIIRSINLLGAYVLRPSQRPASPPIDALPTDDFRVLFFEDEGGLPGTVLAGGDFLVGSAAIRRPTDGALLNGLYTPIEFSLDLGDGIELNPSTRYWMSIVNDPDPDTFWVWGKARSSGDFRTAVTNDDVTNGPWSLSPNNAMFFELNTTNIPEPSTCHVSVLLAAVAGAFRGVA